MYLLPSLTLL
jgi:COP9 signalosome complex subunit 3